MSGLFEAPLPIPRAGSAIALFAALLLGAAAAGFVVVEVERIGIALGAGRLPARLLLFWAGTAAAGLCLGAIAGAQHSNRARLIPGLLAAFGSVLVLAFRLLPAAVAERFDRLPLLLLPPTFALALAVGALAQLHARLRLFVIGLVLFGAGLTLHFGPWPGIGASIAVPAMATLLLLAALLLSWLPPAGAVARRTSTRGSFGAGLATGGLLVAAALALPAAAVAAGLPAWSPFGLLLLGLAVGLAVAGLWRALHSRLSVEVVTLLAASVVAAVQLLPPVATLPPQWAKCMPLAVGAGLGVLLGAALAPGAPLQRLGAGLLLSALCAALVLALAPAAMWPLLPFAVALAAVLPQLGSSLLAWPVAACLVVCLLLPPAPTAGSVQPGSRTVLLAQRGFAAAIYRRDDHEVQSWVAGRLVDAAGPTRQHAPLLAGLGRLLQPRARHIGLLGLGTGRLLSAWQQAACGAAVSLVEHRPADRLLFGELQADGPVPLRPLPTLQLPAGVVLWQAGLRTWLCRQPAGSVDLLMLAAPLGADEPWLASEAFHLAARRALGPGLLLQACYLDTVPTALLRQELQVATAVHRHCAVLLVRNVVVLLAAGQAIDFAAAAAGFGQLPADLRWSLHAAGCGSGDDLLLAQLVRFAAPLPWQGDGELPQPAADLRRANLELLRRALAEGAPGEVAAARLQRWLGSGAEQAEVLRQLALQQRRWPEAMLLADEARAEFVAETAAAAWRIDPADASAVAQLAAAAASAGHIGCPSAVLQAALSLQGRIGEQVLSPAAAMQRALAIDPTLQLSPPPVFAALLPAQPPPSPLEDFAVLPAGDQLARLCTGDSPQAVALRVVYPSACARALLQLREERPWRLDELAALRELADPFVLAQAAAMLAPLHKNGDLIGFWRRDLPMPSGLEALLQGDAAARLALANALCGHDDGRAVAAVAGLLLDPTAEVRTAAAAAMFRLVGERIRFDPLWPESQRRDAADRLLSLQGYGPAGR